MMKHKFSVYVSPSGTNRVQEAIDAYDDFARANFEAAVRHLAVTPRNQWHEPHGKKLKNLGKKFGGLYEIRYKADRKQTRALGFFGEQGSEFIIVLICTHKGSVYQPPEAFDSAGKNFERIQSGEASFLPLKIDGRNFPPDENEEDSS